MKQRFIKAVRLLAMAIISLIQLNVSAQSLTGTWEGRLAEGMFFQMNIIQNGDQLCGYSYDYVLDNPDSYCKEYFVAHFNNKKKKWELLSTEFIENAPKCTCKHLPMRLELMYTKHKGKHVIKGTLANKNILNSISSMFSFRTKDGVYLEKTSDKLRVILPGMKQCYDELSDKEKLAIQRTKKDEEDDERYAKMVASNITTKPVTENDADKNKNSNKTSRPINATADLRSDYNIADNSRGKEAEIAADNEALRGKMLKRENETIHYFKVNTSMVNITIYDNGVIDDDSVSVFDNAKVILSHRKLTSKPIKFTVQMSEEDPMHEITLFAENLGRITPNTAYMLIEAGGKQYALKANTDLSKNATVLLQYDKR
jgi:hypothetical protein